MSEKALQVSPQTLITWKWKAFQNKLKGVIKTERRLNGGKQRRKCINPPTLQLALLLQVKSELHYWNICDSSFGIKQEYRHSVHTGRVSTVRLPWASLLTTCPWKLRTWLDWFWPVLTLHSVVWPHASWNLTSSPGFLHHSKHYYIKMHISILWSLVFYLFYRKSASYYRKSLIKL